MKKGQRIVALALFAMLVFGNSAGAYVYAAETAPDTMKAQALGEDEKETAEGLTQEELVKYYGESVFVGDSIMVGFRNYCAKQEEGSFLRGIQFLAAGSYSAFNATKPVTANNVHPLYKGKKYQVWDAVSLTGAKRVFLLLGMNDISILGLEGARDQYKSVIDKILEENPDVEIHVLSVTYTLKNKGKGKLNNKNIDAYNVLLQEMAEENGWGYMDVNTPISDGNGNLAAGYCSDGFVHLSPSAYSVWTTVLEDYANAQHEQPDEQEEETQETEAQTEGIAAETESKAVQSKLKEQGEKNEK